MGWQHPGEDGQWPHLDQLWADPNIDLVSLRQLPAADRLDDGRRRPRRAELDLARAVRRHGRRRRDTMNGLGLPGRSVDLFDALSQGEHRGRPVFQLVLLPTANNARPRPRPERFAACRSRCRRATGWRRRATPTTPASRSSPASNCAGGGTTRTRRSTTRRRRRMGLRTGPQTEWVPPVEVDPDARIRLRRRSTRRPISRTSSSTRSRPRASRPIGRSGTRRTGLPICRDATTRSHAFALAGGLRILEHGRPQRDQRRRPADAAIGVLLRLELGRAAVPDLPDRQRRQWGDTGNWQQGDWVERAAPAVAAAVARRRRLRPAIYPTFPALGDPRLVGSLPAEVLNR